MIPQEVESLLEVIDELLGEDKTIIFITHQLGEALRADKISVLRDETLVGTVSAADASQEELVRMMVGRDVLLGSKSRRPRWVRFFSKSRVSRPWTIGMYRR